jgi:hypothetical protein
MLLNYSSPANRVLPLSTTGSILSPDDETLDLIKYLKENINRLQLLTQKFTNEGKKYIYKIYRNLIIFFIQR